LPLPGKIEWQVPSLVCGVLQPLGVGFGDGSGGGGQGLQFAKQHLLSSAFPMHTSLQQKQQSFPTHDARRAVLVGLVALVLLDGVERTGHQVEFRLHVSATSKKFRVSPPPIAPFRFPCRLLHFT
jgi:hypothetical protein